ncbi:MAG: hypothetical protein LBG27_11145, partial [Spirochaetaceae bacterium]|nr:hypothetical protein [Spirochaetaceae bacterium]
MRQERELAKHVWYWVQTSVNISEPLFRLPEAKALFLGVLGETAGRYGFDMRGLVIEDGSVSFSIKSGNGLKLPLIMQRLKQTFAVRLNVLTGRQGHVWGERYRSEILAGDPPEWAKAVDWAKAEAFVAATPIEEILTYKLSWGSPRTNGKAKGNRLSLEIT